MVKSIVDAPGYNDYRVSINNCSDAIENALLVLNDSIYGTKIQNIFDSRVPPYLRLVDDVKSYFEEKYRRYHDPKDSLMLSSQDYIDMTNILRMLANLSLNDGIGYSESFEDSIKEKMGIDYDNFVEFRQKRALDAIKSKPEAIVELKVIEQGSELSSENVNKNKTDLIKDNFEILSEQYLQNRISLLRHFKIIEKNPRLIRLLRGDYSQIRGNIRHLIDNPPELTRENVQREVNSLRNLDYQIWSEEIEYQYELILLENKMKELGITRVFPAIFSNNVSKTTKNTINQIEQSHRSKEVDKKTLSRTINLVRTYLERPTPHQLSELNNYVEKNFPKESVAKYFIRAMTISLFCVALSMFAIAICIKFGVPVDNFIGVINQIGSGLKSIYPPLKEIGLAIGNFGQQTAFVLPQAFGGDTVPVWSLAAGACAGTFLGLGGMAAVTSLKKISSKAPELSERGLYEAVNSFDDNDDDFSETESDISDFEEIEEIDEVYQVDENSNQNQGKKPLISHANRAGSPGFFSQRQEQGSKEDQNQHDAIHVPKTK